MATDEDSVRSWFDDFIGVKDRKKIEWSNISREDKKDFLVRHRAKQRVREGSVSFMVCRRNKGLGTYDVDNHVVNARFSSLHREFLKEVGARRELWSDGKTRVVVREKGRLKTWALE